MSGKSELSPAQLMEVRDDGRYATECVEGHAVITILQELKFEVLFEIGAYAITDGYYREAVSSFTSALERFYEFVIRVVLHGSGLSDDLVANLWKPISRQSERQLGAFIAVYASAFQTSPALLANKQIEFRNAVIHQGQIPTRAEAVAYGQAILELIRPSLRTLKSRFYNSVQKIQSDHLKACRGNSGQPVSSLYVGTIISLVNETPGHDERPLEQCLAELLKWTSDTELPFAPPT